MPRFTKYNFSFGIFGLIIHTRAAWSTRRVVHDLIALIIFGEEYKILSFCLRVFPEPLLTSLHGEICISVPE
jgi:hypothetical protein